MQNIVLLTAAGHGSRLGGDVAKQWHKINGISITEYTLRVFLQAKDISKIVVLYNKENLSDAKKLLLIDPRVSIMEGGATAQKTREIGLKTIDDTEANVIIHDAVRPLVSVELIEKVLKSIDDYDAVVPILKNRDTLFNIKENRQLYSYDIVQTQTPQVFKYSSIMEAFKRGEEDNIFDSFYSPFELLHHYGYKINFIDGELLNFKITYVEDIDICSKILKNKNAP